MTISPGFLAELRSRIVLSDIIGRKVTFDRRKSNPRKRDFWACCPFHHEKSPSFHVEDDKGRYYCFGCGAKGDAVTFVMETESLAFREAVESLASDAGLQVPAPTPQAAQAERVRADMASLSEEAAAFFERALQGPEGSQARDYLVRRGIKPETIARFRLGYAPGTGKALLDHLVKKGAEPQALIRAGLAGQRDGRAPYDYFRNRLMFPITDRQGRVIGFGGRVLDPGQEPKYLNSPETDLFKKGRVLYNLHHARAASRDAGTVIVAEGYMDVIAFDRAGLTAAVAPLGTALTEDQLAELWRLTPEPVLCFDGDAAGLKAAYRALDTALPLITPERTLRIALLEGGQDPDDLLRSAGPDAVRAVIAAPRGLADLLWQREVSAGPLASPEQRAGLEARLNAALDAVGDRSLQFHFRQDMRGRLRRLFTAPSGPARRDRSGMNGPAPPFRGRSGAGPAGATPELKASPLALQQGAPRRPRTAQDGVRSLLAAAARDSAVRERQILAMALRHPHLAARDLEAFADLEIATPVLATVRRAILAALENDDGLDSSGLKTQVHSGGLGSALAEIEQCRFVRRHKALEETRSVDRQADSLDAMWQDMMSQHHFLAIQRSALTRALDAYLTDMTPETEAHLIAVRREIERASQGTARRA